MSTAVARASNERYREASYDPFEKAGSPSARPASSRQAVRNLCEVLGVAVPAEQEAALRAMSSEDSAALRDHLKRERRWPLASPE